MVIVSIPDVKIFHMGHSEGRRRKENESESGKRERKKEMEIETLKFNGNDSQHELLDQ